MKTFKKQYIIIIIILLIVLFFSPLKIFSQSWESLGDTFMGTQEARMGFTTSLNEAGNRIAVGSHAEQVNGIYFGKVQVYEWDGNTWQPMGDPVFGHEQDAGFGTRIALDGDGNRFVVSEHGNDGGGFVKGAVYVYEWDGNQWIEIQEFIGDVDYDYIGSSDVDISLDGYTVAIGAIDADINGVLNAGQVKVFTQEGTFWLPVGQPINGSEENQKLGKVALNGSGNKLVLGAFGHSNDTGIVQMYTLENGSWSKVGQFIGDMEGRRIGFSVTMDDSGSFAAATSIEGTSGNFPGQAYIFKNDGNDNWSQYGSTLIGENGKYYGYDIAINGEGNTLAVSAPNFVNDGFGTVFTLKDDGTFFQPFYENVVGSNLGDQIGYGISFNHDASRMSIGAPWSNNNSGMAMVFQDPLLNQDEVTSLNDVNIFPNPTTGNITIKLPSSIDHINVNLFDISGRMIFQKKLNNQIEKLTIPGDSGVYILEIFHNKEKAIKRILKI